jgi:hypothetical protein
MSIFDHNRVGKSVRCQVVSGIDWDRTPRVGYIKWTHAAVGQVVRTLEVIGAGKIEGRWIIEKVDVPA